MLSCHSGIPSFQYSIPSFPFIGHLVLYPLSRYYFKCLHASCWISHGSLLSIGEGDLPIILLYLEDLKADCFKIGTLLHLHQGELNSIERKSADHAEAMIKIISNWLKLNYNWKTFGKPSWKALVKAVASPMGGNNTAQAVKIAESHPG